MGGDVKRVIVQSSAVNFTLSDIGIELTVPKTVNLSGNWPSIISTFSFSSTDTDFLSFSGHVMTIKSNDLTKNGLTHTRTVTAKQEDLTGLTSSTTIKITVYACDTHNMIPFTIDPITVEMSYIQVRTLPVAHDSNSHVPTLICPMKLSTPDGPDFIYFLGY